MFLDHDSAPGGGGGDKPERVEVVSPAVAILVTITAKGVEAAVAGVLCAASDVTDEEMLAKLEAEFPGRGEVEWSSIVRTSKLGDDDYNRWLPACCPSDPDRTHFCALLVPV